MSGIGVASGVRRYDADRARRNRAEARDTIAADLSPEAVTTDGFV